MNAFQPGRPFHRHGESLPHWQQGEVWQFVTFRQADSLPKSLVQDLLRERDDWLSMHPKPWTEQTHMEYHRLFSRRIERWLDQGMGSCLFAHPDARGILADVLMKFDGVKVHHLAWVIMPNHVHLLFAPLIPVAKLVQAWKGHSSRVLGRGPIWQRDYFDTMIRDADHFANALRYIRRNPVKARLPEGAYSLWERSADAAPECGV